MNIPEILDFLKRLSENNTREWFQEHKAEYQHVQSCFEDLLATIIARISLFDESVSHVRPHDCNMLQGNHVAELQEFMQQNRCKLRE